MADADPEVDTTGGIEEWVYESWLEMGFHPVEALALVAEGLSPSAVREFVRCRGCSARDAVAILL